MNLRVNRVWETQFWVRTRVSQTQVPKTVQLTKLFHPHDILLIFFQKHVVQQIFPELGLNLTWLDGAQRGGLRG